MSQTFAQVFTSAEKAFSFLKDNPALHLLDEAEELLEDLKWFEEKAIEFHRLAMNNEDASFVYNQMYEVIVGQYACDEAQLNDWISEIATCTAFH